ncbi:unnamed protein product, partial [marine sediment metagenome]
RTDATGYDNNGNTVDELRRKVDDLCIDNTGFLQRKMAGAYVRAYLFDRNCVGGYLC